MVYKRILYNYLLGGIKAKAPMEYQPSASFLGLPLVHMTTGAPVDGANRRGARLLQVLPDGLN